MTWLRKQVCGRQCRVYSGRVRTAGQYWPIEFHAIERPGNRENRTTCRAFGVNESCGSIGFLVNRTVQRTTGVSLTRVSADEENSNTFRENAEKSIYRIIKKGDTLANPVPCVAYAHVANDFRKPDAVYGNRLSGTAVVRSETTSFRRCFRFHIMHSVTRVTGNRRRERFGKLRAAGLFDAEGDFNNCPAPRRYFQLNRRRRRRRYDNIIVVTASHSHLSPWLIIVLLLLFLLLLFLLILTCGLSLHNRLLG